MGGSLSPGLSLSLYGKLRRCGPCRLLYTIRAAGVGANVPHGASAQEAYSWRGKAPKPGECAIMADEQRAGQRAFNELYATNPEIANQICGGVNDPFYVDTRLESFYIEVARLKAK